MLTVYVVCFWVGFLLTVALAVLGVSGQFHADLHLGGDTGGHGVSPAADGAQAGGHPSGPHFFNLYSILAFVTAFGGVGYVLASTGVVGGLAALLCAVAIGLILAWVVFTVLWRLVKHGERVMHTEDYNLVGMLGYLSTAVPPGGVGEMKYTLDETIRSIGARSSSGNQIAKGTEVVILAINSGIATVIEYDRHVHTDTDSYGTNRSQEGTQ